MNSKERRALELIGLITATWVTFSSCVTPQPTQVAVRPEKPARATLWVDGSSAPGGDGSKARPLKQLPAQLRGADYVVKSGLYAGPFSLEDATLEGQGEVVLVLEQGEGTVVTVKGGALKHLSVRGGAIGVDVQGTVTLDRLDLGSHRAFSIRATQHSTVTCNELKLSAIGSTGVGIRIEDSTLTGAKFVFGGGFAQAIDASRAVLDLANVKSEGAGTGLRLVEGRATLTSSSFSRGHGAALLIAHAELDATDVTVVGHATALTASRGATVHLARLTSTATQEAAVTGQSASIELSHSRISGAHTTGAIFVSNGATRLDHVTIGECEPYGVLAREGTLTATNLVIDGIAGEGDSLGDGVTGRTTRVSLRDVQIRHTAGFGVLIANGASLDAANLHIDGARLGAVHVERVSTATIKSIQVAGGGGAAISATENSVLRVGSIEVLGPDVADLWVDCASGSKASYASRRGGVRAPDTACVRQVRE